MHFILAQTSSLLPLDFLFQMFYDLPDTKKYSTSGSNYLLVAICMYKTKFKNVWKFIFMLDLMKDIPDIFCSSTNTFIIWCIRQIIFCCMLCDACMYNI